MASLGEFLRQERERRGVSLEDVARVTRVRRQHLEALEADRMADLPAAPFVRGFLQAYARYLGLPPADVLGRFQEGAASTSPRAPAAPPAWAEGAGPSAAPPPRDRPAPPIEAQPPRSPRSPYGSVLVLVGLVGLGALAVLGSMLVRPRAPVREVVAPVRVEPTAPPVAPAPSPVAAESVEATGDALAETDAPQPPSIPSVEPASTPGPPARAAARTSTLAIAATEEAWVQVVIDGAPAVEALLQPGERVTWRGGTFDIVVGNAGGVTLHLDGVRQPPLGESGRRAALTLPRP